MSIKHDKTWQLLETWLKNLSDSSPINISFITKPIHSIFIIRIKAIENIYTSFTIYSWLIKKGIYPILLFSVLSSSIGYSIQRTYTRSTQLFIHLVGVLYPTWQCWQLIKDKKQDDTHQLKSWLTYWLIFGSFQVLDHYMKFPLVSKKKYNLYKLFILYWAQSPHSNGAQLLYRRVLQKPNKEEDEEDEKFVPEFNQHNDSISSSQEIVGYSYLNGYTPPNLLNSNSSDDEDSVKSNVIHIENTTEKETFPPIETGW